MENKDKRLIEVTCFYKEGDDWEFDEKQAWKGIAFLDENLVVEGIVKELDVEDALDCFICGTLFELNGASIMKFSNNDCLITDFFGMSNGEEIFGTWSVQESATNVFDAGRCKLVIKELQLDEEKTSQLETAIEKFKSEMSEENKDIYESLLAYMDVTVSDFVSNLETDKNEVEAELGFEIKKLEIPKE